jgi:NAD(P)H-hydrate epimerase
LNADLPTPIGDCVKADVTITFTAPKPATVLAPSSNHCGELVVADIGSPVSLIEETESSLFALDESDAFSFLLQTRYTPDSYKNTHGHALVIAGSRGMSGAAVLCGSAAMRSGAGLVTIATPASSQPVLASKAMPEIMTVALAETERGAVSNDAIDHVVSLSNKVNVVAVGPGLSSDDERTCNFVRQLVARRITPMVIDADGLNALSPWPSNFKASDELPLVLTPHIGEMRRLIGESNGAETEDRVAIAREFATANHVIVVLKGTRTLIAAPDGLVFVNPTGNAGLGTAGAGDTLTGVIAGFLAQSYATLKEKADPVMSTIAAVYVSGLAGDIAAKKIGMRSMVASDIREHLSDAVRQIDPIGERS